MINRMIPFGSLAAIIVGVLAVMTIAGAFDSDESVPAGENAATLCAEGAEDCDDTVAVPVGDGDDVVDAPPPGNDASGTCPAGTPDCDDTPGDGETDLPLSDDAGDTDEGEALAIEAAFAEVEAMGGPPASEFDSIEVRAVDWPNACLGVDTPGIACAQVITPGYIVVLDNGLLAFEFHTNASGHAVLADPAE